MIYGTLVPSVAITVVLATVGWASTRHLRLDPGPWQSALEGAYSAAQKAVEEVVPGHAREVLPFVATLWLFVLTANLMGIVPGLKSPTDELSTTAALAVIVYFSVHVYGIRINGLREYLAHYVRPNPILLPFHLVGELSRTLALAMRLFGNMMSLEMAGLLVLLVAGLLVPIPVLMLHIVEAMVQAYIFGMLALVYIGGAIQSRELEESQPGEKQA